MTSPDLTVLTPSLNHGRFIGQAVDSVRTRADIIFEHLVIDAASTDETSQVLAARPHIEVHLQPDLDSHEALNFGLARARGDIIGCINCDDHYEPGALDDVVDLFRANPDVEIVFGGIRFFFDVNGIEREIGQYFHQSGTNLRLELTFGNPGFNSWFFRRRLLERLGGFRPRFPFAADRDLLLRAYAQSTPRALRRIVYHYRAHEGSRTMDPRGTNRRAMILDHLRLIHEQTVEVWQQDQAMRELLAKWEALERFKLAIRSVRHAEGPIMPALLATPWRLVPSALRLRHRWQRLLAGSIQPP